MDQHHHHAGREGEIIPAAANTLFRPTDPLIPVIAQDVQVRVRTPRAERVMTSCSECRRRKQKCDQGRPCSNCVKRFPQPACEYKQNKRHNPALANEPAFKVLLPDHIYDFQTYGGVHGPVFPSSIALQQMQQYQPLSTLNLLVPTPMLDPTVLPQQPLFPPASLGVSSSQQQQQQQQQQPWNMFVAAAASESESMDVEVGSMADTTADPALDLGLRWPQLEIMPSFTVGSSTARDNTTTTGMPLHMATDASASPDLVFGMGLPPSLPALPALPTLPTLHFVPPANSTLDDFAPILDSSTALSLHHQRHEVLDDAFRILRTRRAADDDSSDGLYAWLRILTWTAPPGARREALPQQQSRRTSADSSRSNYTGSMYAAADELAPKLIQRFRSSLEDHSSILNPYRFMFVPSCLELPLLAQVAVSTSAAFLRNTGYLDELADGVHNKRAAQLRHAQLHTGDEAITASIQLVMDEWYFGQAIKLNTRLHGLCGMIQQRGVKNLGTSGLIGKLAMTVVYLTAIYSSDMAIALPFETNPVEGSTLSSYTHAETSWPSCAAHNSPLVADLPSFSHCADALQIHATTASILDDVRFLIAAVLALPDPPDPKDLQKIQTTARWIRDRIQKLLPSSPSSPRSPEAEINGGNAKQPGAESARRPTIVLSRAKGSASPHLQPLSPCGSADGSIAQSVRSNNSDYVSRCESTHEPLALAVPLLATAADRSLAVELPFDPLYEAVRQTALIYTRAILQQKPLKDVVEPDEFARLWDTAWHVSLTDGKDMVGVFMWVALSIVSSARDTPHDRFVKSMLSLCTTQMSLESWEVALRALRAALRLNVWLASGQE